jgi:hypothetical protein
LCSSDLVKSSFGTDDDPDDRNDVFTPVAGSAMQRFTSPAVRGAQRWLWIQVEGEGTVAIDYVRVDVTQRRPEVDDYAGWFRSSDDGVDRAWYAGVYTGNVATIRDARVPGSRLVHVDGAKRDRLVWIYNSVRGARSASVAFDDAADITRATLNLFACQQEPSGMIPAASQIANTCPDGDPGPPDGLDPGAATHDVIYDGDLVTLPEFTAWWVVGLHEHFMRTGDAEFVRPLLPVARRAVQFFADRSVNGLYYSNTEPYEITWHVPDAPAGADTHQNISRFRALRALAALEREVAGDPDAAARREDEAEAVRAAIVEQLWDPVVGAFVVNNVDPQRDHVADANVEAVEAGIVVGSQAQLVLDFVERALHDEFGTRNSERPANPFMRQYHAPNIMADEVAARFAHGDEAGALDLVRRGFVRMADADPGTMWESIGPDGGPFFMGQGTNNFMSFAHPISSIAPALSEWVLGIRPATAGFATWTVAPHVGDLEWAQGQVPTPHGALASRWVRDGDSFRLTVEAPKGTAGEVTVPLLGADRVIARDGVVVWDGDEPRAGALASRHGDAVVFEDERGASTYAWVGRVETADVLVRKNVLDLSAEEKADFVGAVLALKATPSPYDASLSWYDQFVQWHVMLYRCYGPHLGGHGAMGGHGGAMFLPWHRQFTLLFEEALQEVSGKAIAVPYWDWTDPASRAAVWADDLMGGDGDPDEGYAVTSGPFRKGSWELTVKPGDVVSNAAWQPHLVRKLGTTVPVTAELEQWILERPAYDTPPYDMTADPNVSFRSALEGWWRPVPTGERVADPIEGMQCGPDGWLIPTRDGGEGHNEAHNFAGGVVADPNGPTLLGTMTLPHSPSDPVFFLNHANVDRLWAEWQARHPGAPFAPAEHADMPIEPFGVTARELLDIDDLGYRYG